METNGVMVGRVKIGGGAPISIQSMTNTDTRDVGATAAQIRALAQAGCDIVRVAVYDDACAKAVAEIKDELRDIEIPIVADIQFDYRFGLLALEAGVDKLRFNPGNIGKPENVRALIIAAREAGVPLRIGVNAGSLDKDLLQKYGGATPAAMVESVQRSLQVLERESFYDTVLSLKASGVVRTVEAYRMIAQQVGYPLHVGLTEAGRGAGALTKSAIGIGSLLLDGIGDTIRVSITGDPIREVKAAQLILSSLGIRRTGIDLIACPTCGRCCVDLEAVVKRVETCLPKDQKIRPLTVAVMGCVVNGPGEARSADIGIAFGETGGVIFKKGERLTNAPIPDIIDIFIGEIFEMAT